MQGGTRPVEFLLHDLRTEPIALTRTLHHCATRCGSATHEQGNAAIPSLPTTAISAEERFSKT
jgi:hypothetical protein